MVTNNSSNNYATSSFIVSATPGKGNYTTISSAYAAAVAAGGNQTVFLKDGTYTENITLTAGVNISAFGSSSSLNSVSNVTIAGTLTLTGAGTVTIYGVKLQTNSAALLAVTGSSASIVNLEDCYLNCTNTTGITFSSSSGSSAINLKSCQGDIGTTGISLFSQSGSGLLFFYDCDFTNNGGSSTANTTSAGGLGLRRSAFGNPFTISGTGALSAIYLQCVTVAQNTTCITDTSSSGSNIQFCYLQSGTASCISVGASANLVVSCCEINSTNTNAITGAGIAQVLGNVYAQTSQTNVTTQTGGSINGLTQGSAPSAGFLGQQIRATLDAGSATSLVNNTAKTVTSISLTSGIWDVSGIVGFISGASTLTTQIQMSISTTNNALQGNYGDDTIANSFPSQTLQQTLNIPSLRITLAATTTIYLTTQAAFTVSTLTAYGRISATRAG